MCERLEHQDRNLCRILNSMTDEIMILRAVKATVEVIFGQKINVEDVPKVGAE